MGKFANLSLCKFVNSFSGLKPCSLALLQLYRFTNSQIYKFSDLDLQIYKFENLQIYKFTNLRMYRFTNLQIFRFTNSQAQPLRVQALRRSSTWTIQGFGPNQSGCWVFIRIALLTQKPAEAIPGTTLRSETLRTQSLNLQTLRPETLHPESASRACSLRAWAWEPATRGPAARERKKERKKNTKKERERERDREVTRNGKTKRKRREKGEEEERREKRGEKETLRPCTHLPSTKWVSRTLRTRGFPYGIGEMGSQKFLVVQKGQVHQTHCRDTVCSKSHNMHGYPSSHVLSLQKVNGWGEGSSTPRSVLPLWIHT